MFLPKEYACFQKIDVSRKGIENWREQGAKTIPKSSFGRAWGFIFCDFGRLCEGSDLKWTFDQSKGWQQISQIVITAANCERDRCFGAGSAVEGWPVEAFGV